jgi:small subunit ribosomal protein S20
VKKARLGLAKGALEEANEAVAKAARELDKAAGKGVIHRNAASRRKSRLMRQLAVVTAAAAQGEVPAQAAPRRGSRAAAGAPSTTATTRARPSRAAKAPEATPPVEPPVATAARAPRRRIPRPAPETSSS